VIAEAEMLFAVVHPLPKGIGELILRDICVTPSGLVLKLSWDREIINLTLCLWEEKKVC
jgi:hypothetical protein